MKVTKETHFKALNVTFFKVASSPKAVMFILISEVDSNLQSALFSHKI